MICKWCALEIERSPKHDLHVQDISRIGHDSRNARCSNKVSEAWRTVDDLWLTCEQYFVADEPFTYHEPFMLAIRQMVADLQAIEIDLR